MIWVLVRGNHGAALSLSVLGIISAAEMHAYAVSAWYGVSFASSSAGEIGHRWLISESDRSPRWIVVGWPGSRLVLYCRAQALCRYCLVTCVQHTYVISRLWFVCGSQIALAEPLNLA
ncbi:hypothetical protein BC834DRAFT_121823 [Gloeopeniophorella convolvens]|nr:hypothetical protein BC834DRAFT_121823 [Gloeopeniophorella convolvens]